MNESFHKVDNDQEQIPYGNGMGEGNGVRLHKLQRELFFHLIFKNKRDKTLKWKFSIFPKVTNVNGKMQIIISRIKLTKY